MNLALAREIYGPWCADHLTYAGLVETYKAIKTGLPTDAAKLNPLAETRQTAGAEGFSEDSLGAINVIKLNGALTKNGGESTYGTDKIARDLARADADAEIIGHVLHIESGGGSVNAIPNLADAIKAAKKPVVTLAEDVMASAAYWIGMQADYVFARRGTDTIGSIGVMLQLYADKANTENPATGERHVRLYASSSANKNEAFELAINAFDFELLVKKELDPIADRFAEAVKEARPNATESQLTGRTYDASEVVGTLLDGIGTLQDACAKVVELHNAKYSNTINTTSAAMTKEELQAQHPQLFTEVVAAGVAKERTRVLAFAEFADTDPEAVKAGLEGGDEPNSLFFAKMAKKAMVSQVKTDAEDDSPGEVDPQTEKLTGEQTEFSKLEAEVAAELGLTTT